MFVKDKDLDGYNSPHSIKRMHEEVKNMPHLPSTEIPNYFAPFCFTHLTHLHTVFFRNVTGNFLSAERS